MSPRAYQGQGAGCGGRWKVIATGAVAGRRRRV